MDETMCQVLWEDSEVKWEANPAENSADGILYVWSESSFVLEKEAVGSGFILLEGTWKGDGEKITIVNIYSPCDANLKRNLWNLIRQLRSSSHIKLWCIVGDFNRVRRLSE